MKKYSEADKKTMEKKKNWCREHNILNKNYPELSKYLASVNF